MVGVTIILFCCFGLGVSIGDNWATREEFNLLKSTFEHELKAVQQKVASLSDTVAKQTVEINTLNEYNTNLETEISILQSAVPTAEDENMEAPENIPLVQRHQDRIVNGELHTGNKRYLLGSLEMGGIAFTVTLKQWEVVNLGIGQTIHFDSVISNLGNAFNSHTSTFQVPVSGWYALSLSMMNSGNDSTQELDVVVNGNQLFHCYAGGKEQKSASRTVVSHLNVNDDVWVQTAQWGHDDSVHGNDHTSFTGFLLYSD